MAENLEGGVGRNQTLSLGKEPEEEQRTLLSDKTDLQKGLKQTTKIVVWGLRGQMKAFRANEH